MTEPRDPRVDPRPGDVLRNLSTKWTRRVVSVIAANAFLSIPARVQYTSDQGKKFTCSFETWRKWAKDAEVLKRGE